MKRFFGVLLIAVCSIAMTGADDNLTSVPTTMRRIPVSLIRENKTALREVDRKGQGYQELLSSIQKDGVIQSITVREMIDTETKQKYYGLVDGLHRLTAAKDAGLTELDCKVIVGMSDYEVLRQQLVLNIQRVETRPVEYSKQLARMMNANLALTTSELAEQIGKSPQFISERMGLLKLNEKIAKLVDAGEIKIANAVMLAKLPVEEQPNFVDRAMTMEAQEFIPTVTARVKAIRESNRKGEDVKPAEFVPVQRLRKLGELKDEAAKPTVGPVLVSKTFADLDSEGQQIALKAFALGIKWTLHVDDLSIAADKAKDEARKAEQKAQAEIRAQERAKKKDADQQTKAISTALGVQA